jgi:hypothetical protein
VGGAKLDVVAVTNDATVAVSVDVGLIRMVATVFSAETDREDVDDDVATIGD